MCESARRGCVGWVRGFGFGSCASYFSRRALLALTDCSSSMSLLKFDVRLREMVPENSSLVVIGAHDFGDDVNDPVYKSVAVLAWSDALLVEANPQIAASLQHKVAAVNPLPLAPHQNIRVLNLGVCPEEKKHSTLPFYTFPATPGMPFWISQIGSFSRAQVELSLAVVARQESSARFTFESLKARIAVESVKCSSMLSLLRRRGLSRIGVLLIDTEGLDCDIVAAHDWSSHSWCHEEHGPTVLVFEWKHCRPEAFANATGRLLQHAAQCRVRHGIDAWPYRLIAEDNENVFFSRAPRRFFRDDLRR